MSTIQENMIEIGIILSAIESKLGINQITYREVANGEIIQECFENFDFLTNRWKPTVFRWIDKAIVQSPLTYRCPINVEPIFPEKKFEITIPNSCRTCPVSYCHMQSQYYTKIDCKIRLFEYFLSKKD